MLVALLIELAPARGWPARCLPVVAAFTVGCAIFLAAEADLLDGPLLPPLAVLLPGALIVTGMSELAAGAMVAGTARLVFGSVRMLFTFGLGGFAGGLTAALGAAVVRRPGGPPSLVVFVPSFWLLVPGSLGLIGTTQLAADTGDGFATALGAIAVIVAIALGVLVGSAVGRAIRG